MSMTSEELVSRGYKLLAENDLKGAVKAFSAALAREDVTPIRNNLAMTLFQGGEPQRALDVLQPAFSTEEMEKAANPFTYALAASINTTLGQPEAARQHMEEAIRCFEKGLAEFSCNRSQIPRPFQEYTVSIMRAAAGLNDHRLVMDLYRRWESCHVSWENKYLAGVACFNLGRYKQAARFWLSIAREYKLFSGMQLVALLVERGVIPPFTMGYKVYNEDKLDAIIKDCTGDKNKLNRYLQDGYILMMLLAFLLMTGESPAAGVIASSLVGETGAWGEKLGLKMLETPEFTPAVKMAAAEALIARGVLKEEEPFPMLIDGEKRLVRIQKAPVILVPDPELDTVVEKAFALRDQGQVDAAIELLRDLHKQGKYYFRAMMALANLLRVKKETTEALKIMTTLKEIAPEDPALLFNYAALMLQMGRRDEARAAMKQIDREGLSKDFLKKLELLELELKRTEFIFKPMEAVAFFGEREREQIEAKALPQDASLLKGLKNMPVSWLDGACSYYGLEPARLRREREKQLVEYLSSRKNLAGVAGKLQEDERELLRYLLQKGGFSRMNAVSRIFGSMQGDGFFWQEEPPASTLGRLWAKALVMVGKADLGGRKVKIATIPVELRQPLKDILGEE